MSMSNLIRLIGSRPVTTTNLFTSSGTPDTDGLLSGTIFGLKPEDRRDMTGYIDLKGKYIHPLIYKRIFKRSYKDIDNLISGSVKYEISKTGELIPSENGKTGLKFLYDNFDNIKFRNINEELESKEDELELSLLKQDVRKLLKRTDKESVFVDKWLVIAVGFRDIDMTSGSGTKMGIDELNGMYRNLINKINVVEDNKDTALFDANYMRYQVQMSIVQIFEYFKGILFGKYGIQRKRVMSKNVDFGTRVVITPPDFQGDRFDDQVINIDRCGMPLSSIAANCYLFLGRRIKAYLTNLHIVDSKGNPFSGEDKEIYYNSQKVNEYRDTFVYSWGERLKPILAPDDKTPVMFTYEDTDGKSITRKLTVADLMYMFSYSEIELTNKHTMSTRHPVMDSFNIIPAKIHVLSTLKTKKITIDGLEYPYYPDLDYIFNKYNLDDVDSAIEAEKELSGYFIEAKKLSSLHLPGLNGDFDKNCCCSLEIVCRNNPLKAGRH